MGLMRSADGQLHIFLNGRLKAKCDLKLPPNIHAVVDMFGKGCEVTIIGNSNFLFFKGHTIICHTCYS